EGMVYNLGAAAVGCLLGIGVSMIIVQVMERLFSDLNLGIVFNVTPRSLIVSYSIGVVLTFITVTFSSWRIGNLNIVSAIRDIPDQGLHADRPEFRGLTGAANLIKWLIFKPRGWPWTWMTPAARGRRWAAAWEWLAGPTIIGAGALQVAISIGMFMVAGGLYDTSAAGSTLAVIIGVLGGAVMLTAVGSILYGLSRLFQIGAGLTVIGVVLVLVGLGSDMAAPFGLGFSAAVFGIAMVLAQLRVPARPVYTAAGVFLLISWLVFAGANTPFDKINELEGNIDMFFVSGVAMVLAGTFVIVYNADLMLGLLTLTGGVFSRIAPSIRTAVAYPLANKFRTGMTIAMISLVMFALVMMTTIQGNFDRIFLADEARGGYDVVAYENPSNPVPDLVASLQSEGGAGGSGDAVDTSKIEYVDSIADANPSIADLRMANQERVDWQDYSIMGVSEGFMEHNELKLQSRAKGYDSDGAVWDAMRSGGNYAVIDAFAVGDGGFGDDGQFQLQGVEQTETTFDPPKVLVHDASTGKVQEVEVIGVLNTASSGLFSGLLLPQPVFDSLYEKPLLTVHFVKLQPGTDATQYARDIERTLLAQGVQADSIQKIIDDYQAQSRGFLYLIQGFMGIGLFVGIAAVGVIAFRTVVERRQQIGMLRAIGYRRNMVALSFMLESLVVAALGVLSGTVLALILSYNLINSEDFQEGAEFSGFVIPWGTVLFFIGASIVAAAIMTWV
ncbi:MAG TPA: FtsX-like permease family protein, partial [Vicinamibacterales bacterium]|nr:FtsX-like permease family protein [Vicinamibacterales bacterium]